MDQEIIDTNTAQKPAVFFEDWGLVDYKESWDRQSLIHHSMIEHKRHLAPNQSLIASQQNRLVFVEHPHVYTLGKSGSLDHLKLDEAQLAQKDATFYKINRGGDITYHGPGQIVGYFLFDLDCFKPDVHLFVRNIEEGIIRTLKDYNIEGLRIADYTGVWVQLPNRQFVKLCAIGVHLSRWVSMHGFAFNINPQLNYFNHIVACGIADQDKAVSSLQVLSDQKIDIEEVKSRLRYHYQSIFDFDVLKVG